MSDIMDEFEFKPLTEGLGFHPKKEPVAAPNSSVGLSLSSSLGFPTGPVDLTTPLPRTGQLPKSGPEVSPIKAKDSLPSTTVDEILKTLQEKRRPEFSKQTQKTRIDASPEPQKYKRSTWDFSAFMLDSMLVLASNLLCLVILLLTTKIDLFSNLYNPDSAGMVYISLASLFLGTAWIYMVATRVFLGCTPGEWIFDQRLGLPEETGSALYTLKTVLRSTIMLSTGLIFLPVLSALVNRDLVGKWLNLELQKKV